MLFPVSNVFWPSGVFFVFTAVYFFIFCLSRMKINGVINVLKSAHSALREAGDARFGCAGRPSQDVPIRGRARDGF